MRPVTPCLLLLLYLNAASAADDPATIRPAKPTIEHKEFNPARKPPELLQMDPNEEARTTWQFSANIDIDYTIISDQPTPKGRMLGIRVDRVRMDIGVDIVIFLPIGASQSLSDHEEGHRKLTEHYYADAPAIAAAIAGKSIAQTFYAEGADAETATKAATDKVVDNICGEFVNTMKDRANRASVIYDQLTNHGRKTRPTADEAVATVIKSVQK